MSYYVRNGNSYRVLGDDSIDIQRKLPVGNYIVQTDTFNNLYLEKVDSFKPEPKLYGNFGQRAGRIIETFNRRDVSTGVMLNGEKGSGKTLLARTLALECAKLDIPTIIINNSFHGDRFNRFIQEINQPAVILFDEFEKVYDREKQEAILTLFDGVFPTKKLFIITCNDKYRVDNHMRNRPGRIYYMIDFKGLQADFITDYCNDNLKNKNNIKGIVQVSHMFTDFNFDMLKALVDEMNYYDETALQAIDMLNANPETSDKHKYVKKLILHGKEINSSQMYQQFWHGNPLRQDVEIEVYEKNADDENECEEVCFTPDMIVNIDATTGAYTYKSERGVLILTRHKTEEFDFRKLF